MLIKLQQLGWPVLADMVVVGLVQFSLALEADHLLVVEGEGSDYAHRGQVGLIRLKGLADCCGFQETQFWGFADLPDAKCVIKAVYLDHFLHGDSW